MSTQQQAHRQIIADGASASALPAAAWRGLGLVSGGGSSRLLMDYKEKHPEIYQQILTLLFGKGCSAGLTHLKLEMGSDVNPSSGTEPCTMRSADEKADVTRGAGFRLAADARTINPLLELDLLRWGEPAWVTNAFGESKEAGFAARYHWYHETLKAAFETYGLTFDYISADANEPELADTEWLLYFSEHLKNEKDAPYDFSAIRIVASEEMDTCTIAEEMMQNEALRGAVDVIGLHHMAPEDENIAILHEKYGKEIWYSEGLAPCNIPALSVRADGSGLAGVNGAVDVASRIIQSYAKSRMVMYEFQPAVAGYYDGTCYMPKQLITANTPWSGHYSVDAGFWMAMQFTRFAAPGWQHLDSACLAEEDVCCMALVSPAHDKFTMHLTNDSSKPRSFLVVLRNLPQLADDLYCVETAGTNENLKIDQNWFRVVNQIRLHEGDGETAFPVVVKPFSILTITSVDASEICGTRELPYDLPEMRRMPLPYTDRFDYTPEFLRRRGGMPLYMTDQGGAFEVVSNGSESWLEQKIEADNVPTDWRFHNTPEPLTSFGDDHWANYQAVTEAEFGSEAPDNYIGVGLRYNSAVTCPKTAACGFSLRLHADGRWVLHYMDRVLANGSVPDFCYAERHKIGISAIGTLILCFADGHSLHEQKLDQQPIVHSGRMSLQSAYYRNRFYAVTASPMLAFLNTPPGCYRIDCMAQQVAYSEEASGTWTLRGMAPYQYYNRTCAEGEPGSVMEIRFYGTGISLLGTTEGATIAAWIDGKLFTEEHTVERSTYREAFFAIEPLSKNWHTLRMKILSGKLCFDTAEILTDDIWSEFMPGLLPNDPLASKAIPVRQPHDLKKMALPIAGAAAAGLAIAFTAGQVHKKLKGRKKK